MCSSDLKSLISLYDTVSVSEYQKTTSIARFLVSDTSTISDFIRIKERITTAPYKTFKVVVDNKVFNVAYAGRTYRVTSDNKVFYVGADKRKFKVVPAPTTVTPFR